MLTSPENYILAEIEKKFQDQYGELVIDTTWSPEEYVTLEGIAMSVPRRTFSQRGFEITGKVNKGDRIFFSYAVVYDYEKQEDGDTPVYKNLILYEGREYWKVHAGEIFCTVSSGEIKMVTDNILVVPESENSGRVIGKPNINLSCNMGDVVCFEPKFVQKYNIFGAEHFIIPSRYVIAKV
jgi:hypothetical protein